MAATEHLHHTHDRIKHRIRELEDAIQELHSRTSSEPHPLLSKPSPPNERFEDTPSPPSVLPFSVKLSTPPKATVLTGTLAIEKDGSSRFLGPGGAYDVSCPVLITVKAAS